MRKLLYNLLAILIGLISPIIILLVWVQDKIWRDDDTANK